MFTGQKEYIKLWTLQCLCLLGSDHYKQYLFWNFRATHEFVTMFPIVCSGLNVPGKNNPCTRLDRKSGRQAVNPLNAQLNPICHLLALLGAQHILHVSRVRVKAPRFQNNQHMKVVRSSALLTGRFYPQEIFPGLISVSACGNPRTTANEKHRHHRESNPRPFGL